MNIKIRRFIEEDIPYKVKWINDNENNKYLHYDLPLTIERTKKWFKDISSNNNRADYTIICNDEPAGLIGLLNIDLINRKAEFYIVLGDNKYKGKGIATIASDLLIKESNKKYDLNKIYLFTEVDNILAQILFERIGFLKEGCLVEDLIINNKKIDRFIYGLSVFNYLNKGND